MRNVYTKLQTIKYKGKKSLGFLFWFLSAISFTAVFFAVFTYLSAAQSAANPPSVITYQGKLYDNGLAVSTTQSMQFIIYNGNGGGATALYTASGTLATPLSIAVTPSSGVFAIDLGGENTNELDKTIFQQHDELYLEVVVGGTTLTPRKRISSVPYAFNSEYLSGIAATTTSSSTYIPVSDSLGAFTFTNTTTLATTTVTGNLVVDKGIDVYNGTLYIDTELGYVGIGTTTPTHPLYVNGQSFFRAMTTVSSSLVVGVPSDSDEIITNENFVINGDDAYIHDDLGVGGKLYVGNDGIAIDNRFSIDTTSGWTVASSSTGFFLDSYGDDIFLNYSSGQSVITGGTVSVNTSTELFTLTVDGTSYITGNTNIDGTVNIGNGVFYVDSTSAVVGINSSTPTTNYGLSVNGVYSSGNLLVDENYNAYIGTTTEQISKLLFNVDGNDLYVHGDTGIGNNLFVENILYLGEAVYVDYTANINEDDVFEITKDLGFADAARLRIFGFTSTTIGPGTDFIVDDNLIYADTSANSVGINSSSPSFALSVGGNAYVSGQTYIGATTTIDGRLTVSGGVLDPRVVGTYATGGGTAEGFGYVDIDVSGNYVYAGLFEGAGIQKAVDIIDVSNPESPVLENRISISQGNVVSVDVVGNYLYVGLQRTTSGNHFIIYDISNPSNPILIGGINNFVEFANSVADIQVVGNYAYVTETTNDTLTIIDVSNPTAPTTTGRYTFSDAPKKLFIRGKYAFVASALTEFDIIDISNPRNPSLVASTSVGTSTQSIFVKDNIAYVGDIGNSGGLVLVDISDIKNPVELTEVNTIDIYEVFVSGDYAFVVDGTAGDGNRGLHIIDVSSSTRPREVSSLDVNSTAVRSVFVRGNYAYIAGETPGVGQTLHIVDVAGATIAQAEIGSIRTTNLEVDGKTQFTNNVQILGGLTLGGSGLLVNGDLTLALPTSTQSSATNTLQFSHQTLFKTNSSGNYGFIFDTNNLFTYSNTSTNPQYLLSVRNNGTPTFSVNSGGDVHTTGTYHGLGINVSTPGQPGDLAERVDIDPQDTVTTGDVLCVDTGALDRYSLCKESYDQKVAGVISTKPTITLGNGRTEYTAVMALVGRVPVKVNISNGAITRGDLLVASAIPGQAMKYDANQEYAAGAVGVIGVALDSYNGATEQNSGKIMALVRTGWVQNKNSTITDIEQELLGAAEENGITIGQNPGELNITQQGTLLTLTNGTLDIAGGSIINIRSISGQENKWLVDDEGRFVTNVNTGAGPKPLYAIQSQDTEFVLSGSGQLESGYDRVPLETITQELIDPNKPMKISITLTSEANGIFVAEKDITGFVVKELHGGQSNATYDWVLIAHRRLSRDQVETTAPIIENNPSAQEQTHTETEQNNQEVIEELPSPSGEGEEINQSTSTPEQQNNPPSEEQQDVSVNESNETPLVPNQTEIEPVADPTPEEQIGNPTLEEPTPTPTPPESPSTEPAQEEAPPVDITPQPENIAEQTP